MHKEYSINLLLLIYIFALSIVSGCAIGSHGSLIMCSACHVGEPTKENPSLKYSSDPSKLCNDCHDYKDGLNHHPASIISGPFGNTAVLDPSLKLYGGEMACLTCHQIHVEGHKMTSRNFLVGGPYKDKRELCFRCHRKEVYEGINPHNTMIDENNKLEHGTCLICHSEIPNPSVDTYRTVKFRAAIAFLCWRCHPPMPGTFLDKHFLRQPSKEILVEIRRAGNHVPRDHMGRITCSSCHNPHQPGVMQTEMAAEGAGENKSLRRKNICSLCHPGKAGLT